MSERERARRAYATPGAVHGAGTRQRPLVHGAIAVSLTVLALQAPALAQAQDWRTFTSSRASSGNDLLRVDLEYGAGRLDIGPGERGTMYRTNLRYDAESFRPRVDYASNRLRVGIQGQEVKGRKLQSSHLDLKLGPDVPLDLNLKFGAAEANLELGGLRIRRGEISTGASSTTLKVARPNREKCSLFELNIGAAKFHAIGLGNLNTERFSVEGGVGEVILNFTGSWQTDMTASIRMGLGSLTLQMPRGVGLRVRKQGFLASFDSQGLVKRGNAFYSEDWDRAKHKLSLDVEAALGSIKVVWLD